MLGVDADREVGTRVIFPTPTPSQRVVELAREGRTRLEIETTLGLSVRAVAQACKRAGLDVPRERPEPKAVAPLGPLTRAQARGRRAGEKYRERHALNRPTADPLTVLDRAYTDEEREFLTACEAYRCRYAKRFLNATDYLVVAKGMGYARE